MIIIWSISVTVIVALVVVVVTALLVKSKNKKRMMGVMRSVTELDDSIPRDDFKQYGKLDIGEFKRKARLGRAHARKNKIIFSTIIETDNYIQSIARMYSIGKQFSSFVILVCKSSNMTLKELEGHSEIVILNYDPDLEYRHLSKMSEERSRNLSEIRNSILIHATENYRSYEYYCVFYSGLAGPFDRDGFFGSLSKSGWIAVTCNGIDKKIANDKEFEYVARGLEYYVPIDESIPKVGSKEYKEKIFPNIPFYQPFPLASQMMRVRSAFGGCIIYRLRQLNNCKYSEEYYDHVSLHWWMIQSKLSKIYINPNWLVFHN